MNFRAPLGQLATKSVVISFFVSLAACGGIDEIDRDDDFATRDTDSAEAPDNWRRTLTSATILAPGKRDLAAHIQIRDRQPGKLNGWQKGDTAYFASECEGRYFLIREWAVELTTSRGTTRPAALNTHPNTDHKTITFTDAGLYTIKLTCISRKGKTVTAQFPVEVHAPRPVPSSYAE